MLAAAADDDFLSESRVDLGLRAIEAEIELGRVGARVGPYRLVRSLGEGGMGRVYAAERADGAFEQTVAVKLLHNVFPSDEVLRRFQRERDILATLNHPNIAHILDAGPSELGPFLAMELVEGEPLLKYCQDRESGLSERLELFATVCDAVHFAHQKRVIHRDLKPSNVFVTRDGMIKLLDFGIAALIDDAGGPTPGLTRTGMSPMTPEYASPEQIRGEPASVASDTYALGVLLYELLTGQRPHRLSGLSPSQIERAISERTPTRPSLAGHHRELRGDLDTIVLKAMHKEESRRYSSVAALVGDLRRHLEGRPVKARPDRLTYRLSTWTRRNRVVAGAAAAVATVVVLGVATTLTQAQRADSHIEGTRDLANVMLFDLDEVLEDLPGSTQARARFVSQALASLDELTGAGDGDPELLLDAAEGYARIGAIQGNPLYTNLGDLSSARASYQRALDLSRSVWARDTVDPRARRVLGASNAHMAVVTRAEGDMGGADAHARRALELLGAVPVPPGGDPGLTRDYEGARVLMARNQVNRGDFDHALATLDQAVSNLEAVASAEQAQADVGLALWDAYSTQVDGLRFSSRWEQAHEIVEGKACPMLERLAATHPTRASILYSLQSCLDYLGLLEEKLDVGDADASYRRALESAERLAALDPANEHANEALTTVLVSLGRRAFQMGRVADGEEYLGRAIEVRATMEEDNPANALWTSRVASARREYCRGLVNNGDPTAALPYCHAAVESHVRHVTRQPGGAIAEVTLAFALGHTARAYRDLSAAAGPSAERRSLRDSAAEFYRRSLAAYERAGSFGDDPDWEIDPDSISAELALLGAGDPSHDGR